MRGGISLTVAVRPHTFRGMLTVYLRLCFIYYPSIHPGCKMHSLPTWLHYTTAKPHLSTGWSCSTQVVDAYGHFAGIAIILLRKILLRLLVDDDDSSGAFP